MTAATLLPAVHSILSILFYSIHFCPILSYTFSLKNASHGQLN